MLLSGSRAACSARVARPSRRTGLCTGSSVQRTALLCQAQQRTLLVAVDDHQRSWHTVKYALEHVYRSGDLLTLLHVIPWDESHLQGPPVYAAAAVAMGSMESMDLEEDMTLYAEEFTKPLRELARGQNALCNVEVIRASTRGPVGRVICEHAEKSGASVVIVAGGEMDMFRELLQGPSIAQYVVSHCSVPVLVTRFRAAPASASSAGAQAGSAGVPA